MTVKSIVVAGLYLSSLSKRQPRPNEVSHQGHNSPRSTIAFDTNPQQVTLHDHMTFALLPSPQPDERHKSTSSPLRTHSVRRSPSRSRESSWKLQWNSHSQPPVTHRNSKTVQNIIFAAGSSTRSTASVFSLPYHNHTILRRLPAFHIAHER